VLITMGLMLSAASGGGLLAAQAPVIRKPMPAPNISPNVPPLPPAVFDNGLNVGGQDLKAREVDTRLYVDVLVNARGPYRFVVDSGADTSVVGLRIARDLQLPLGTPAILNATTSRNLVDRVRVSQLTLGPTTVSNLELPALKESDVGGDGLIGIDALTKQRLMLDFERRFIKVEDAARPPRYDPRDIVIIALAQSCGLLRRVFSDSELRSMQKRIDQIAKLDLIGQAMTDMMVELNAALTKLLPYG
jgi:hypothetical protein